MQHKCAQDVNILIKEHGMQLTLEHIIEYIDKHSDDHKYLKQLSDDLSTALKNYKDRY